jgi:hypothetical protein
MGRFDMFWSYYYTLLSHKLVFFSDIPELALVEENPFTVLQQLFGTNNMGNLSDITGLLIPSPRNALLPKISSCTMEGETLCSMTSMLVILFVNDSN